MKKISKKEIQNTIEAAVTQALASLHISAPSKKTKKVIERASRKVSGKVKSELKRLAKRTSKADRAAIKNG